MYISLVNTIKASINSVLLSQWKAKPRNINHANLFGLKIEQTNRQFTFVAVASIFPVSYYSFINSTGLH